MDSPSPKHSRLEARRNEASRQNTHASTRIGGWVALLVALAWVHRLAFLASNLDRSWGFTIFYEGDAETFYNYARALISGRPYDAGIPFHPPGFAYALSLVHRLVGAGAPNDPVPHLAVKMCMALLGSLPVGLTYLLARPLLGHASALLGAVLLGYSFSAYVVSVAPVSESLYMTLLLLSLVVWSYRVLGLPRSGPHPSPLATGRRAGSAAGTGRGVVAVDMAWSVGLGLILGALSLTRAEGVLIAATMLAITASLAWTGRGHRRPGGTWTWLGITAGFVIALTPWTLRNAKVLDQVNISLGGQIAEPLPTFVPVTAYGPLNFALANHPGATGSFSRELLTSGLQEATLDLRDPQHLEYFLHGYRYGTEYLRNHPADALRLVLAKWRLYLDTLRNGYTQWNLPAGLHGVRRPVDAFVSDRSVLLWTHLAAWILGVFVLWRPGRGTPANGPRRWLAISILPIACGLVVTAAFFGYARLGTILLPFLYPTMAFGLVTITQRAIVPRLPVALRRSRLWWVPMAILLLLELWGATGNRNYEATGTQLEGASHLNPHETMYLKVIPKQDE